MLYLIRCISISVVCVIAVFFPYNSVFVQQELCVTIKHILLVNFVTHKRLHNDIAIIKIYLHRFCMKTNKKTRPYKHAICLKKKV